MLEYILSFSNPFTIRNITSKCAENEVAQNNHVVIGSVPVLYLIILINWEEGVGQHGDFGSCAVQYLENILICTVHYCALMDDGRLMWIVNCTAISPGLDPKTNIFHIPCAAGALFLFFATFTSTIALGKHINDITHGVLCLLLCRWLRHIMYRTWIGKQVAANGIPFQWNQETKQQQQRAGIQTICT